MKWIQINSNYVNLDNICLIEIKAPYVSFYGVKENYHFRDLPKDKENQLRKLIGDFLTDPDGHILSINYLLEGGDKL